MRRAQLAISTAAVLVLGAGVVLGRLSAARPNRPHGRGWFIEMLDLSTEQRKQMDAIWADTRGQFGKIGDRRRDLDRERDAAINALITDDRRPAFERVWADYRHDCQAIDADRDRLSKDADARSRALLTDAQKARWDAMQREMRDRKGNDHRDGRRPGPPGPPPLPPLSSRPSTDR